MSGRALHVLGLAACGPGAELLPDAARLELPPPGTKRKAGRLPGLAERLSRAALGEREPPAGSGSLFGTRWGCLTETDDVLTPLVREHEALPRPRSFSSSVHNAIASHVALALSLTGECQTHVQGETAFAQALFAARHAAGRAPDAWWFVGALDERPPGSFAGLAAAANVRDDAGGAHRARADDGAAVATDDAATDAHADGPEGGAVLLCGPDDGAGRARIDSVALAQPRDARAWFAEQQQRSPAELSLIVPPAGAGDPPGEGPLAWLPERRSLVLRGAHDSSLASACALAAAWLAGALELPGLDAPRSVAVLARATHGDAARIGIAAP